MRRIAKIVGIAVFVAVELFILFGFYVVASIRCCGSGGAVGPADAGEWVGLAILVLLITLAAGAVGGVAALIAEGVARLAAILVGRRKGS